MPSLVFTNVSFSYTTPLLDSVSFECSSSERICVVGPNGAGKSTLLQLASGELQPDSGTISGTGVPAVILRPEMPLSEVLSQATESTRTLLTRFATLSAELSIAEENSTIAAEYDRILHRLLAIDGWSLDATIAATMASLGLADLADQPDRPVVSLSPGQQGRLQLAATTLSHPETLLLDEPTNHLDSQGITFLKSVVSNWPGPVLFASHDRDFINDVATSVVDLDTESWQAVALAAGKPLSNGVYQNRGNYQDFLEAKQLAHQRHVELHQQQQTEKRQLERHRADSKVVGHTKFKPRTESRIAKKFYADRAQQASTRRITNDDKRLSALSAVEVRKPRTPSFSFPLPPHKTDAGLVISVDEAMIPQRLAPVSFEVSAGEKLLITGPNGTGKSTLLRWLATATPPTEDASGTVFCTPNARYLPQELPDHYARSTLSLGELGKGFVNPRYWATPLSQLSLGNQRRAQLAQLLSDNDRPPEVLLLDEPTNFLDLAALETLESALLAWPGTVVIISHDQWLIRKWPYARLDLDNIGHNR